MHFYLPRIGAGYKCTTEAQHNTTLTRMRVTNYRILFETPCIYSNDTDSEISSMAVLSHYSATHIQVEAPALGCARMNSCKILSDEVFRVSFLEF